MKATRLGAIFAVVVGLGVVLFGCQSQPAAPAVPTKASVAAPTQAPAPAPTTAPAKPAAQAPAPAPTQAPAATAAPAAVVAETLKIGLVLPLTGPVSRIGSNTERFTTMGMEQVNANGGVKVGGKTYKFEGVTIDTQFTAEGGRTAANRLVLSDKIKFITGCTTTDCAGAQAVTEPNKALMLAFSAADTSLGKDYPLTLQPGMPHTLMRVSAVYNWLVKEKPKAKNVIFVTFNDISGQTNARIAEAIAKQNNLTSLGQELFPNDTKDFGPIATRALRQKPDVVDVGSAGGVSPIFTPLVKALYDQGYRGIIVSHGGNADTFRINADVLKDLELFVTNVLLDYESPLVGAAEKQVIQQYLKKYPAADMELVALPAYNALMVLAQAIQKAGTVDDTEKLAKTMQDGEWDTMFGKSRFVGVKTFGRAAVLEQPVYLTKFEGGKGVTLARVAATMP